jgi:hypothetical protein
MVDIGGTDMLESRGNGPKDLDRVCTLSTLTMVRVKPRRKGKDDNHEGIAEC